MIPPYGAGIYEVLSNDATVLSIVSTYGAGELNIWDSRGIPTDRKEDPIINYFANNPIDGGSDVDQTIYSVNCRARNESDADALGKAVFNALKRVGQGKSGYDFFFVPALLATIPPLDETDYYNSSVDVIVKARPQ